MEAAYQAWNSGVNPKWLTELIKLSGFNMVSFSNSLNS